jgi:hypothetical protein
VPAGAGGSCSGINFPSRRPGVSPRRIQVPHAEHRVECPASQRSGGGRIPSLQLCRWEARASSRIRSSRNTCLAGLGSLPQRFWTLLPSLGPAGAVQVEVDGLQAVVDPSRPAPSWHRQDRPPSACTSPRDRMAARARSYGVLSLRSPTTPWKSEAGKFRPRPRLCRLRPPPSMTAQPEEVAKILRKLARSSLAATLVLRLRLAEHLSLRRIRHARC